jgi:hypothetical protein
VRAAAEQFREADLRLGLWRLASLIIPQLLHVRLKRAVTSQQFRAEAAGPFVGKDFPLAVFDTQKNPRSKGSRARLACDEPKPR